MTVSTVSYPYLNNSLLFKSFLMKRYLFVTLLLLLSIGLRAQEKLGIANSNYAGVTGLDLNPSSMVDSRLKWDVNIIGADIFLQNNYVYVPNIFNPVSSRTDTVTKSYSYLKDYYTPNPTKNVYMSIAMRLPSVMFRIRRHTFAILTGYRTGLSINDLDYRLARFAFAEQHLKYGPQQNMLINSGGFKIAGMTWGEIGLSYGYKIRNTERYSLSAAVTVKRTFANMGVFLNNSLFSYKVVPSGEDQNLNFYNLDMTYGHAGLGGSSFFSGGGFGFDAGFTYIRKKKPEGFVRYFSKGKIQPYDYKIGLSIIDLGSISFNDDARINHVTSPQDTLKIWNGVNQVSLKDLTAFDQNFSNILYNDPNRSYLSNSFIIGLPTAVSLQADFNLNDKFYLNGTWVQSTPIVTPAIIRPSQVGIALRYETKYFEVGLPYSLYNYTDHRIGLAFRLGPLIVGSDKLGAFMGLNDFTGADIYFAIKVMALRENEGGYDPNRCFYKRIFARFKKKRAVYRTPVVKF